MGTGKYYCTVHLTYSSKSWYCSKQTLFTDEVVDPFQLDLVGDFDTQVNNVLQTVRLTRQQVDDLRKLFFDLERSLQTAWQGKYTEYQEELNMSTLLQYYHYYVFDLFLPRV